MGRGAAGLIVLGALTAACGAPTPVNGLHPAADAARSLRVVGHTGIAQQLLTQAHGRQSRALRDEVADTLVAFSMQRPVVDALSAIGNASVVTSLFLAGIGETGLPGKRGIAYAGAAPRLRRLADSAHDVSIRSLALERLTELEDGPELLGYLRRLSVSNGPIAYVAVEILTQKRGLRGRMIARHLYRSGAVTSERARRSLQDAAHVNGWGDEPAWMPPYRHPD